MTGKKKISDLLALGLFLISLWLLSSINGVLLGLGKVLGNIGAGVLLVTQAYFLLKTWGGKDEQTINN